MAIHDWSRVDTGIFHDFHHSWMSELLKSLNSGLLPDSYYALAEAQDVGFGPNLLGNQPTARSDDSDVILSSPPATRFMAVSSSESYRRGKSTIAIRYASGDGLAAIVDILSPTNKRSNSSARAFIHKASDLLHHKVHLLLLDLFPPTSRDPNGIHAAIWEEVEEEDAFTPPPGQPLTLVSYESTEIVRAFIEPVAVGETLPDMPLFLEPDGCIMVPLEATYNAAFAVVPRRWRTVLESVST